MKFEIRNAAANTKKEESGMRKLLTLALTLSLALVLCLPLMSQAETLSFESEALRLHFSLPENWVQAEDEIKYVFMDPEGNGAIMIAPTNMPGMSPEMVERVTPAFVQTWIRDESNTDFTDIQQLLFTKTVDEAGNLYAISSCGCTDGGTPFIYAHYFFTAVDGTLASVTCVSVNSEAGLAARSWFDQMLADTIPAEIMAQLAAQLQ
jgi:hypothetical protein